MKFLSDNFRFINKTETYRQTNVGVTTVSILYIIFRTGGEVIRIIEYAMLIYCVLSWFQPRQMWFYKFRECLQPFVMPFQGLAQKVRERLSVPLDFTFLFAILGYQILERLWWTLYRLLAVRVF